MSYCPLDHDAPPVVSQFEEKEVTSKFLLALLKALMSHKVFKELLIRQMLTSTAQPKNLLPFEEGNLLNSCYRTAFTLQMRNPEIISTSNIVSSNFLRTLVLFLS